MADEPESQSTGKTSKIHVATAVGHAVGVSYVVGVGARTVELEQQLMPLFDGMEFTRLYRYAYGPEAIPNVDIEWMEIARLIAKQRYDTRQREADRELHREAIKAAKSSADASKVAAIAAAVSAIAAALALLQ